MILLPTRNEGTCSKRMYYTSCAPSSRIIQVEGSSAIGARHLGVRSISCGSEIDFVWERGTRSVGIELKASSHWRREFALPLRERLADGSLKKGFGVYLWDKAPSRRTRCLCYPYKSSCRGSGAAKFSANGSLPQT